MSKDQDELRKIDNELFRLTNSHWLAPRFIAFEFLNKKGNKVDTEISNEELIHILQSYK